MRTTRRIFGLTARRQARMRVVLLSALAALLPAAACGSSGSTSGDQPSASSSAPTSGDAAAIVSELSQPRPAYPVPTTPLGDVAQLRGKVVYFIPITRQAPQLNVTGKALTEALGSVGIEVQTCDGKANPSDISACVNQATGARAGAIITDSIPYALAANSFAAAQAKDIPVLITDQIPDPAHPAGPKLGYLEGSGTKGLLAIADWIIADSGGKATVVINVATDTASTQAYVAAAQKEFSARCPGCKVTLNRISSANFQLIAPSTSSAILSTPGVNYVVSEFEVYLQPTFAGVQQSGRAAAVKGVSTAAQINGLQMLAAGTFLHMDVGQAAAYQGWADADAALRMMLGKELPSYDIPIRIFTRDNIKDISVTTAAEASGEWYGPADFPAKFKTLWGLS
ncbi:MULTISPECIES: sugar ABC transporter substrate-binding protein [Pseudofrankia]|uniref:sugar ABC transporter substrate-binding protein n=1 Tax=Pseudofrankia TaxID=2994363 RepID=UPI0002F017E5|nr:MULTISPECIES: substrate-binding domain-containing protein [Pseudofrankia]